MPDTQEQSKSQSQQQNRRASDQYPQSTFDSIFEQMASSSSGNPLAADSSREAWRAYFKLAQETLRTAQEVSEIQVLASMHRQIVAQAVQSVVHQLQSNPQLITPAVQQALQQGR